jgi:hypothetical protein
MTIPRQGVHTAPELHRSTRRLDRNVAAADRALTAIREGRSLHLQYQAGFPIWSLSGGRAVSADIAAILTSNASVAPVGDALFASIPET